MVYVPAHPAIWLLLFMVGASIGSFLNVVAYRWPREESLLYPPSHCTSCGRRLGFWDLIPVFSWILRRGRCAYCGRPFSGGYAIVELVTGLVFVGSAALFGASWYALGIFVVCACLILVFLIDLDLMIIPDELVLIITFVGLAINAYNLWKFGVVGFEAGIGAGQHPVANALVYGEQIAGTVRTVVLPVSIVGFALGGGVFLFVSWFFERVFGQPVMGYGDVKLAAAMGALLGPGYAFGSWFFMAIVIGGGVAVVLVVARRIVDGKGTPLRYGLISGGMVSLLLVLGPLWSGGGLELWGVVWMVICAGVAIAAVVGVFRAGDREVATGWLVVAGGVAGIASLVSAIATGHILALWALISVVCGGFVFVVLLVFGVGERGVQLPFGPMLAVAGIVVLLFEEVPASLLAAVSP